MKRIAETFARCRSEGRPALVAYIMAGNPTPRAARDIAVACLAGGADVLELGFPFSDPIADGPTLQRAARRALEGGMTLTKTLALAASLRKESDAPLVLMGYLNPILRMGAQKFFASCAASGVDGVIIPDLPPDEAESHLRLARRYGVAMVQMLAPTSTDERRRTVARVAQGFVYYVSVTGVTGARGVLPKDLSKRLTALRRALRVPVAVGFGISTPKQVRELRNSADGIVVGSAIAQLIEEAKSPLAGARSVRGFIASLAKAARG